MIFDGRRLYKFRVGNYRLIYEINEEKKAVLFPSSTIGEGSTEGSSREP